jgi:hypothetical protein
MNRRKFLITASGVGISGLITGGLFVNRAYARDRLRAKLLADVMPVLTEKAHDEFARLPVMARDDLRTWFHGPCLNAAEFAREICSNAFLERLRSCSTMDLRESLLIKSLCWSGDVRG